MYEYSSGGIIRVVDDNGLCTLRQPRSLASPLSQQEASGGGGDRNTSYMRIESSRRGTAGGHSCVFTAHTVANDREGSTASSSGGGDKLGEGKEQRGGGVGSDGRRQLHRGDTRRWSRHWGGNTTVGYVSADSSTSTSTTNNSVFSARSTDDSDEFASNDGGRRQAAAVAVDQWLGKDTDGRHHHGDVEAEVMNASSGSVSVSSDDSAALERYEDYLSTSARTRGWTLTGPGGRAVPCEHGAELYVAAPASSTASYYYYHNVEA